MISEEKELFEFIRNRYLPDLKQSEYKYSKYDCYSERFKLDIELKCRTSHYDTLLIEKAKYDFLMQRAQRFGTRPFYINSTPKGIYVFNLSKMEEPNWENQRMPRTSHFEDKNLIVKCVGFLNTSKGTKIYEQV